MRDSSPVIPITANTCSAKKKKGKRRENSFFIKNSFLFFSHQNDSSALIIHPKVLILLILSFWGLFGCFAYNLRFIRCQPVRLLFSIWNSSQPLSHRHHRPADDNRSNYTTHSHKPLGSFFLFFSPLTSGAGKFPPLYIYYIVNPKHESLSVGRLPAIRFGIRSDSWMPIAPRCVISRLGKRRKKNKQSTDTFHYIEWSPWPLVAYLRLRTQTTRRMSLIRFSFFPFSFCLP